MEDYLPLFTFTFNLHLLPSADIKDHVLRKRLTPPASDNSKYTTTHAPATIPAARTPSRQDRGIYPNGPFIDFMLDKILRTLKAKGEAYEATSVQKSSQKSDQKVLAVIRELPTITIAELMEATGLSSSGVKKVLRKLKDANLLRRIGPDKGGHWEVV